MTVYVPLPKEKEEIKSENLMVRKKKRANEPEAVKEWRAGWQQAKRRR